MAGSNPTLAPYAKQDGVHLRITAKAVTAEQARDLIEPVEREVRERLGETVYGADDDTPAGVAGKLLEECGLRLSVLEIGAGAVGALSGPLSDFPALAGGVAGGSSERVGILLEGSPTERSLEELGRLLLARSGADIALALQVREETGEGGGVCQGEGEYRAGAVRQI